MTPDEWVGQIIGGKYRVKDLLGKGGMGLVLHAQHLRLDEEVAIKLLLPAIREVPGMTTRFLREAQAASKIKSRHVARVTDVDVMPDGTPYMIMEYLEGVSLAVLRRQRGALEIPVAVRYVLEACDAIAEAHALGIVHRDLKPANLFLAQGREGDDIVKVLDFGISKIDAPGEQDTTKTGQMMGSPKYMAPEQMLSMHDVDGRADVWSLGAILYDFVAGRTPFMAETTPQLCSLVLNGTPPPPRQFRADLPPGLEAVILRCLEREPARRFASVAELVAALVPFAPAGARIPVPRSPSSSQRHTGSWSSVQALALGGAAKPGGAEAPADTEKPTQTVPEPRSPAEPSHGGAPSGPTPSVTPPSVRSGTVSVWNSGLRERPPSRRRSRAVAVVTAGLVLVAAGGFALRRAREVSSIAATGTSAAIASPGAHVDAPPPATPPPIAANEGSPPAPSSPAPAPLPANEEPAAAPSGGAAAVASAALPPRGLVRPPKKATDPVTTQSDPFAGKRR